MLVDGCGGIRLSAAPGVPKPSNEPREPEADTPEPGAEPSVINLKETPLSTPRLNLKPQRFYNTQEPKSNLNDMAPGSVAATKDLQHHEEPELGLAMISSRDHPEAYPHNPKPS